MGALRSFKDFWNIWELRILVVCSLLLQIFLILAANLRKKMAMPVVKFTLWSAYLLADLVATYSLGVLSRNQSKYSADDIKNNDATNFELQLMALWAPFLLLHLGGPDTITAFSLEDNQLWHRHGLGLAVQVALAANILARYYPEGQLLFSSVLVFVAGVSKYGERTLALKRGSMDGLRISMLGSADPGPDYANTMNKYAARLRAGLPAPISVRPASSTTHQQGQAAMQEQKTKIVEAHGFFKKFKGLFVDSIFTFEDRKKSRSFFLAATAESAFKVVEIELSFAYDVLYTKASVARTYTGVVVRGVSLITTAIATVHFMHTVIPQHSDLLKKQGNIKIKVYITYALFCGAILIEILSLVRLVFSDWTIILIENFKCWRCIQKAILVFRPVERCRWSNAIWQFNLLGFCLKDRRRPPYINSIADKMGLKTKLDSYFCTNNVPLTSDLQQFIFQDLKEKSEAAQGHRDFKHYTACRGQWALSQHDGLQELVGWSVVDAEFDESLLIWHIATDLCYRCLRYPTTTTSLPPDQREQVLEHRKMAHELSNYLLYLLVFCPLMLSSTAVVGVKKFMDTCAEATKQLKSEPKKLGGLEACRFLLSVNTDHRPVRIKGDGCKSVLWDGCKLAKTLELVEEQTRWKIICTMLLEMLCYVAIHCRGYYHAEQLSNGGELLTFIWFLVTHFGMGEQYMIEAGDNRATIGDEEDAA